MFVIAIDPQMIAASLEEAHAPVRSHLPRYERTVPLGWRFMDKFIQLPFTIPPTTPDALKGYVEWLSDTTPTVSPPPDPQPVPDAPRGGESELHPQPQAGDNNPAMVAKDESTTHAVRAFRESRDVGVIVREAAAATSGNPREIKRIANLARLYLRLRNERRTAERQWTAPTLNQYARWIVLTLRWPEVLRWLLWGADEASWNEDELRIPLQIRRLRALEDAARSANAGSAWAETLGERLQIPCSEGDWARDPKLYEFFRSEAKAPVEQRLSAATAFW
jgi:hypothetical protein